MANSDKYDLVKHAGNLSEKSLLIIGGWNDQASTLEGHVLPCNPHLRIIARLLQPILFANREFARCNI